MALGRTIYSERTNDAGQRVVEVGKWNAVPTGPWCSWSGGDHDTYGTRQARDGHEATWRTTPRGGDSILQWWLVSVEQGRAFFRGYKWSRGKMYARTDFASPEDLWSCAYQNAEPLGRTKGSTFGDSWSMAGPAMGKLDNEGSYDGHRLRRAFLMRPIEEIEEVLAILEAAGADPRPIEILTMALDSAKARAAERANSARTTRAHTLARKDRGGNPKAFKVGDRVVLDRGLTYSTGYQRFFWYTTYTHNRDGQPGFYTEVDSEGYGIGPRYKVTKKYLYRACLAAFDELDTRFPEEPISFHTKMALLADQAAAEARRAGAQHQDTAACTCDA